MVAYVNKLKELVVDTSHGTEPLPRTSFGDASGSKPGKLTSVNIPTSTVASPPPSATTDLVLLPGTMGFVVHPGEKKQLATFKIDEASSKGSTMILTREPTARMLPEAEFQILHYAKTCSFAIVPVSLLRRCGSLPRRDRERVARRRNRTSVRGRISRAPERSGPARISRSRQFVGSGGFSSSGSRSGGS